MDYLLDSHTILWFLNGDQILLSDTAKNIIENQQHTKQVSMASVWEVGIKISIGELEFPDNTKGFINQIKKSGFELIPIEEDHVIEIEKLPWIHRDPFDRLLIATANIRKIPIVTSDRNIKQYNVSHIW